MALRHWSSLVGIQPGRLFDRYMQVGVLTFRIPLGLAGSSQYRQKLQKVTHSPLSTIVRNCCSSTSNFKKIPRALHSIKMTGIQVDDGNLLVHGRVLLTGVPENIVLTPAAGLGLPSGAFLGATASESKSRHVFTIGKLEGLKFLSCFRFKLWWMTQQMGSYGKDVPRETQFMLLESTDGSLFYEDIDSEYTGEQTIYIVLLPILEGPFRASLQGNERNELELCLESGDPAVQTSQGHYSILINSGTNPFKMLTESVKAVEKHLQTFHHRDRKKIPNILNWFGWCTWDAFYRDVTAEGVNEGLESLSKGGTPPRFLIIDDGWQSVSEEKTTTATIAPGTQFPSRLTGIKENHKFQKGGKSGQELEASSSGLKHIVEEAKFNHNLKYVYVWHALTGYWGGVKPGISGMEHYETSLKYPVVSPGVLDNEPGLASDCLTVYGLGLVNPKKVFHFYDELHSYLAAAGIDGVKVDVQNIIETLGAGFGGRVSITRQYHEALEASIAHNFPDNGCISCMCHHTDGLYSAKQTAVVRASDDFWPRDPASHTVHIASVAYNSLFLGEFMQPDWDMFHSLHPAAEYHAAARAIGGCAIYVSDKPGSHDFNLLKRLVLPDGSILRAQLPGRPTRDCLFFDPTRDGQSLLKIWNMNKYGGVLGAFNCQGAGWCQYDKKYKMHDQPAKYITGSVHAQDVEFLADVADDEWTGDCAIFSHRAGVLVHLPKSAALPVSLKVLEYEVFTVAPVKMLAPGVAFAPIGLLDMFNAGGAIECLEYESLETSKDSGFYDGEIENQILPCVSQSRLPSAIVKMKVHGCGQFGAFSSQEPKQCLVESLKTDFTYDHASGMVIFVLPISSDRKELYQRDVKIEL